MSLLLRELGGKADSLPEPKHYVRARMFGDPDLTMLPRMPTYETMLAAIKAALQCPALTAAALGSIRVFSARHNAVVSRDVWPIVFKDVDVLVVRCDERAPEAYHQEEEQSPIAARSMGRVCDDNEDDIYANGGERVQTPIRSNQGFHGAHMPAAEDITGSAKIRGASLLPHVRKHMKPIAKRRLPNDYTVKPAHVPNRKGFPAMTEHFDLERTYLQGDSGKVWVVPPRAKHQAVRSVLLRKVDATQAGLTGSEGTWVAHHRLRGEGNPKDDRKLLDNGKELYDALIRAHGVAHYNATATWKKLRDEYVGPSQLFVKMWVERCPTCAI